MAMRRRRKGEKAGLGVWNWGNEAAAKQLFIIRSASLPEDQESFNLLAENGDRIVTESSGEPLRWVLPQQGG